ncbi:MAG: fatty acid kinase [Chloroflexota bacterium]|jgi:DAK2 domain fusion protein YloV|nr:fatty acid kinase [Chloroflexota bacterium]
MLATVRAALEFAEAIPSGRRHLSTVADALGTGALMGARGNSGLILSQVLRGMAEVARGKHRADGVDLGRALKRGAEAAYAAVAQPVEGTILTVAREAADAAADAGAADPDIETVLEMAVDGAQRSVARTPTLLAALREAGVVDSGGHGLFLLLRGLLLDLYGQVQVSPPALVLPDLAALRTLPEHADDAYGYETMFVVRSNGGTLDLPRIRMDLEGYGQSVTVSGDASLANLHVHTEQPDAVIAYGLTLGPISHVNVENLDEQASARRNGSEPHPVVAAQAPEPAQPTELAVVAVVPGEGLERTFRSLGVAAVVKGGATANPSVSELLDAVAEAAAASVILLANHRNVAPVAAQAAELAAESRVLVLETRNAAEGIAAALAFDPRRSAEANAEAMRAAARAIQSLQVTRAVRDARLGGRTVRQGQILVLDPDEGLVVVGDDRIPAVLDGIGGLDPGFELMTIYVGLGVAEGETGDLVARIAERWPALEVEIVDGGQPYYAYLIAAE